MTPEEPTLFPLNPAPQPKFVYSLNGDTYEADFFSDRQQALDAAVKHAAKEADLDGAIRTMLAPKVLAPNETSPTKVVIYTAIAKHAHDQHHYPSGDAVIAAMSETAVESGGGEFAEGYLASVEDDEAKDLERDLHAALDRWFARHPRHSASWFLAEDVQRHEVRLDAPPLHLLGRLVAGQAYRRADGAEVVYLSHAGDWVQTSAGPELVTSFLDAIDRAQFEESDR